ncbi:MAG: hypothetical protein KY455_11810 [Euryarchaeota archaeon]|nr:hypothetical protein [Euryarchaeota archaeon]
MNRTVVNGLVPVVAYTAGQWFFILGLLTVGLALKVVILVWLYQDVRRRGREPLPWLIPALFVDLVVLVVWLIARPALETRTPRRPAAVHDRPVKGVAGPRPPIDPAARATSTFGPGAETPRTGTPEAPDERSVEAVAPEAAPGSEATKTARRRCPHCSTVFPFPADAASGTEIVCPDCGSKGRL